MSNTTKIIAVVGLVLIGATLVFQRSSCGAPKVERTMQRGPFGNAQ